MADSEIFEEVKTQEKEAVSTAAEKLPSKNSNFETVPSDLTMGETETTNLKAPELKTFEEQSVILEKESKISTEVEELSQKEKTECEVICNSNEDNEQYDDVEEEYEEQFEENGEVKVILKKRIVRVKKDTQLGTKTILSEEEFEEEYEEEEVDENGISRTVTKKRIVKTHKPDLVRKGSVVEKENEFVEEIIDETGRKEVTSKSQSGIELVEKADSSVIIKEEYNENQVDTNSDTLSMTKKKSHKVIKKNIEDQQEEKEISEKSEAEITLEEDEETKQKETEEEEETSEGEMKKEEKEKMGVAEEKEEADTDETKSEGERKSVLSLSSGELLLAEEKRAMAEQFEILTKLRNENFALKRRNLFLNNKLVQYFKKQKMDHVFTEIKEDPALEQQYLKKLTLFYESNQQMVEEKLKINTEWEAQRKINEELLEKVKQSCNELFSRKREIAAKLIDPKTGRTVPCDKTIEDLLNRQETQLKLISECRLAQIKLKRRIEEKKIERQMQHAGKEFNLMDYEKLSSLKEYYLDKITERDIEIKEVKQKITAMDDTLLQVKEQLQKKEEDLEQEQERLQKITQELNNKRANLNMLKSARHKTEKSTAKIKQQSGLLAYPNLLKDYEEKTQQLQLLVSQTEALKQIHRAALVRIRKLRETIKQKSQERPSLVESIDTMTTNKIMF